MFANTARRSTHCQCYRLPTSPFASTRRESSHLAECCFWSYSLISSDLSSHSLTLTLSHGLTPPSRLTAHGSLSHRFRSSLTLSTAEYPEMTPKPAHDAQPLTRPPTPLASQALSAAVAEAATCKSSSSIPTI
ncbi:hypothetical protein TIFTF001_016152 [Ficus carica]|uniref:Uncharacterized protein n=1 Tax=Ficus carica TaxID=3494 RepID=A0AA87ZZT8_FICCA|nr:hypothetical protein TIFTF001_016152 [Ficus carica]